MRPAVKFFFPLLLINSLLTAKESDCTLLLRNLKDYCSQVEDTPRREALESQLARLQSALEHYRISAIKEVRLPGAGVFSLQNEISLLSGIHMGFSTCRDYTFLCLDNTGPDRKHHLQNGLRAVTLPAYPF